MYILKYTYPSISRRLEQPALITSVHILCHLGKQRSRSNTIVPEDIERVVPQLALLHVLLDRVALLLRACVRVCARVRVCACVCACARACVSVCACGRGAEKERKREKKKESA